MTTTSYRIGAQTGLDALHATRHDMPEPGPGQALVRMRYAALNHRDMNLLRGRYRAGISPDRIPLSDGAGDIVAVGAGVTRVAPGDRVTAAHMAHWIDGAFDPAIFAADIGISLDGWLGEHVLLPADALIRLPDSLPYRDAAALSVAAGTAWQVVQDFGRVRSGDLVLALGTGGVAMAALQIARMAGAAVAIASSSAAKLEIAREHGAEILIDTAETPDWPTALLAATGGRGADIVVETVGWATLAQSVQASAPNARIGLLGALATPPDGAFPMIGLTGKNAVVKGITSTSRANLERVVLAYAANRLSPAIDRIFGFDAAIDAYRHLEGGGHVGKVLIANG